MKRLLLFTALLVTAVSFYALSKDDRVKGSGPVEVEFRTLPPIKGLRLEGSTNVYITKKTVQSVGVKAYTNLFPYIETRMEGPILVIGTKKGTHIQNNNAVVYLELINLEFIAVTGSGNVNVNGAFQTADMVVSVSGSSNIKLQGGSADNIGIKVSGSGNVEAPDFKSKVATVNISGSGNVQIHASESLKAIVSGSGNVYYTGTPAVLDSHISGSGTVRKK